MIAFIQDTEPEIATVEELCLTMEVSRSGFYSHKTKHLRPRRMQDAILAQEIREAFVHSRSTYGTARLRYELRDRGHTCGRRRIARLMKKDGLEPLRKCRFVPKTTDSSHGRRVSPQLLLNLPAPTKPREVWVTDITYIPTREGWLYLAAEIDLCSRRVVGWAARDTMETELVLEAFHQAVAQTPGRLTGLLHHSDQGSQYASHAFRKALQDLQIEQSMSRRGNCYDNATAESFWATLKTECFNGYIASTRAEARSMIFDYIETFYNPVRRHSALGFLSPIAFEKQIDNN
jgi:transposase InsO family protein